MPRKPINPDIGEVRCPFTRELAPVRRDRNGNYYYLSSAGMIKPNLQAGQDWMLDNARIWGDRPPEPEAKPEPVPATAPEAQPEPEPEAQAEPAAEPGEAPAGPAPVGEARAKERRKAPRQRTRPAPAGGDHSEGPDGWLL